MGRCETYCDQEAFILWFWAYSITFIENSTFKCNNWVQINSISFPETCQNEQKIL